MKFKRMNRRQLKKLAQKDLGTFLDRAPDLDQDFDSMQPVEYYSCMGGLIDITVPMALDEHYVYVAPSKKWKKRR